MNTEPLFSFVQFDSVVQHEIKFNIKNVFPIHAYIIKEKEKKKKRYVEWRCRASIPVPLACKASALPSELHPRASESYYSSILDKYRMRKYARYNNN